MIVLYILLFVVCLSVLIMIHEAGHLIAAKIFKVYCFEYSIGFGPALLHVKRKKGETYFSLRAIPFGGYVSMYGEDGDELPKGVDGPIPPERSIKGAKKWKRAIILVAGVTMNAVLAMVLFFVSELLPQKQLYLRYAEVTEGSVAYNAGITEDTVLHIYDNSRIYFANDGNWAEVYIKHYTDDKELVTSEKLEAFEYTIYDLNSSALTDNAYFSFSDGGSKETPLIERKGIKGGITYYLDGEEIRTREDITNSLNEGRYPLTKKGVVTYNDATTKKVAVILDTKDLSFKKRSYDDLLIYYEITENATIDYSKQVLLTDENVKSISFPLYGLSSETPEKTAYPLTLNKVDGKMESLGMQTYIHHFQNNYGQAVKESFVDFGNASTLIVRSLGNLFIGKGWNEVGGIVAIYSTTTNVLTNFGAAYFIQIWAIISVNLAIFNLLPFPGLDGWQLLVLIVEAIAHKEIPQKVKSIVQIVGIALLLLLMVVVLIKDVIGLF